MKRKVIISVLGALMVLTMALCIFAACNPDEGEEPTPTSYTVTYSLGAYDGTASAPAAQTATDGSTVKLAAVGVTWDGHTFTGWKADGDTAVHQPNEDYVVTGDVTFVAQWQDDGQPTPPPADDKYTVTYDLGEYDGDAEAPAAHTDLADGATIHLRAVGVIWTDHDFKGWKLDGDTSTKLYQPEEEYVVHGNAKFVAQWESTAVTEQHQITYISFDFNKYYETDDFEQSIFGEPYTVTYNGESTTVVEFSTLSVSEDYVLMGYVVLADPDDDDSEDTYLQAGDPLTGDVTVYVYVEEYYYIEGYGSGYSYQLRQYPDGSFKLFVQNGDDGERPIYDEVEGVTSTLEGTALTVTLNGITFTGEYVPYALEAFTASANITLWFEDPEMSYSGGYSVEFGDGSELPKVNVAYEYGDYEGEDEDPEPSQTAVGTMVRFNQVTTPTWAGHKFLGWKVKNSEDDTLYTNGWQDKNNTYLVKADVTFVAQWRPLETYTVTFNLGEGYGGTTQADSLTRTVTEDEGVELPDVDDVVWENHRLVRWNGTDAAGNENSIYPGRTWEPATSDITFTAEWVEEFTVTYWHNGTSEVKTLDEGASINRNAPEVTLTDGQYLDGWYYASESGESNGTKVPDDATVTESVHVVAVVKELGTHVDSINEDYQGIWYYESELIDVTVDTIVWRGHTFTKENIYQAEDGSYLMKESDMLYHLQKVEDHMIIAVKGNEDLSDDYVKANPTWVEYKNAGGVTVKAYANWYQDLVITAVAIDEAFITDDEEGAFPFIKITRQSGETMMVAAENLNGNIKLADDDEISGQMLHFAFSQDNHIVTVKVGWMFSTADEAGQLSDGHVTTLADFIGEWKTTDEAHTMVYGGGSYFVFDGKEVYYINSYSNTFYAVSSASGAYYDVTYEGSNLVFVPNAAMYDGEDVVPDNYTFTNKTEISNALNAEDYLNTGWTFGKYSVKFNADGVMQVSDDFKNTWKQYLYSDSYEDEDYPDEPIWEIDGQYILFVFCYEDGVQHSFVVKPQGNALVGYEGHTVYDDDTEKAEFAEITMGGYVDHDNFGGRTFNADSNKGTMALSFDWETNQGYLFLRINPSPYTFTALKISYSTETHTFTVDKSYDGKTWTFTSQYNNGTRYVLADNADNEYVFTSGGSLNSNGTFAGTYKTDGVEMVVTQDTNVSVSLKIADGEPEETFVLRYNDYIIVFGTNNAYVLKKSGDNLAGTAYNGAEGVSITLSLQRPNDAYEEGRIKGTWGPAKEDGTDYTLVFDGAGKLTIKQSWDGGSSPDETVEYVIEAGGYLTFYWKNNKFDGEISGNTLEVTSNFFQTADSHKVVFTKQEEPKQENDAAMEAKIKGAWGTLTDGEGYTLSLTFDGAGNVVVNFGKPAEDFSSTYTIDASGNWQTAEVDVYHTGRSGQVFKGTLDASGTTLRVTQGAGFSGAMSKLEEEGPEEPDLSEYYNSILQKQTWSISFTGNNWEFTFDGSKLSFTANGSDYSEETGELGYRIDKSGKITVDDWGMKTVAVTVSVFANKATVIINIQSEGGDMKWQNVAVDPTLKGCVEEALTQEALQDGDTKLEFYKTVMGTFQYELTEGYDIDITGSWSVDDEGNVTMAPINWDGMNEATITVTFEGKTATIKFVCQGLSINATFTVTITSEVPVAE